MDDFNQRNLENIMGASNIAKTNLQDNMPAGKIRKVEEFKH